MCPFFAIVGHVEGDPTLGVEGGPEARVQLFWAMTGNHPNPDQLLMTLLIIRSLIIRSFLKAILGQATQGLLPSRRNGQVG